ncbi:MAG: PA2779 family protein [Aliifodinibius sp.]|nr:PA2779 family protein [Fodinibius sp.]
MLKKLLRPVSLMLVVAFCMLNFNVPNVQAKMIGTDTVIAEQLSVDQRTQVKEFLAQEDVTQLLTQYGVDPIEAQKRVDSLSTDELAEVAYSIDQMPAGGGAVGTVVGAAVLIFLVLLVTDLLGLTHVYPFVNHPR